MKAALWYKARDLRVEDVSVPEPGKGQVKIAVEWTGICGSDLHEYIAGPIFIPVDAPHPVSGDVAPIIMGHEFSGKVVAVGEGVSRLAPGDRVLVEPILACANAIPAAMANTTPVTASASMGFPAGVADLPNSPPSTSVGCTKCPRASASNRAQSSSRPQSRCIQCG